MVVRNACFLPFFTFGHNTFARTHGFALPTNGKAVVAAVPPGVAVKVILEVCLLSEEELALGCVLSVLAGAAFVKTSTGFSTGTPPPPLVGCTSKPPVSFFLGGRGLIRSGMR